MAKKYSKIGIRRENNLSDLSSTEDSLTNILGDLVSGTNVTFISKDLDAIRGISNVGISNAEYRRFAGSRVRFTNSVGAVVDYLPRITYQNRFDGFNAFAGKPRLFGGEGLTAKYYNETEIYPNTPEIFSGTPFKVDNFWENGRFLFLSKVATEATTINGGIEWEGYFIPTESRRYTFLINSSSCYTLDFQTAGYTSGIGTYTEISRIGIASTVPGSGTSGSNTITIGSTDTKYVAIGQSVSASGIVTGSKVSNFNGNGEISLSPPSGFLSAVYSTFNGNVTFSKTIGQSTEITYTTYPLTTFERYRIRFRYYIPPGINAASANKYFIISFPDSYLRYNYLYPLDYDFSDGTKGNINRFIDNSINLSGGVIGSLTNTDNYVRVITNKKIDIKYTPKSSISEITKANLFGTANNNSNLISVNDTTNVETGNYIFGVGIPDESRITSVNRNQYITLNNNSTQGISTSYTIVDHRGFVKRAIGSGSGGSFTLSSGNTNNLNDEMIMIGAGVFAYTKITLNGSSSSFTISPSQTIGAGTTVYFYQSRGLINNGLNAFCSGGITYCLSATQLTNSGSTTIFVDNVPSSIGGWSVQGLYFNSGTTITGSTSTSITISSPTIANIPPEATFTIADPNVGEKVLCCSPTDTSPPFNGTLNGLETPSDFPSLRIENGNLIFNSLKASIGIGSITSASSTNTSNIRVTIQTPQTRITSAGAATTTIFKLLCSSQ